MFIGHFAVAFAARRVAPLDFVYCPWSHSLVALAAWAGLLAAAVDWGYWIERHRSVRT